MVLEATRILAEKKVRDARDVDLGLIYGIGFPPFKGGLLFWADTIGAANHGDAEALSSAGSHVTSRRQCCCEMAAKR